MWNKMLFYQLQSHPNAWPFLKPVDKAEAPDYYEHILFPMGMCIQLVFDVRRLLVFFLMKVCYFVCFTVFFVLKTVTFLVVSIKI